MLMLPNSLMFINFLKNFFVKHSRLILSVGIFLLVIILLGIPYSKWGFISDDCAVIFNAKSVSWKNILKYFNESTAECLFPTNYVIPQSSFFSSYFRPLEFVFLKLQEPFFSIKPYSYFLVFIILHAINSVLLFLLFSSFFSITVSFLCVLYFVFHSSLVGWFGWITPQHYILELFFILFVIFLIKEFLDKRSLIYYLFACCVYFLALFTRETLVVFPLILFMYNFYFQNYKNYTVGFKKRLFLSLKFSLGFWFVSIFYFLIRLVLYPIDFLNSTIQVNPFNLIISLKFRFFELLNFLFDLTGISFIPSENRVLKGSIFIVILVLFLWLFVINKKKKQVFFVLFCGFLFLWPAILRTYVSRYLYIALPFFVLFLLYLAEFSKPSFYLSKNLFRKFFLIIIFCAISINAVFLMVDMKKREELYYKVNTAYDNLCFDKRIKDRVLCFIGLPYDSFPSSIAQSVWIREVNLDLPIYAELRTYVSGETFNKKNLDIMFTKNGFRIKLKERDDRHFVVWRGGRCKMGKMIINEKSTDASFTLDEKHLKENLLFVTWDFENGKFKIL